MSLLYGPRTGAVGILHNAQIATVAALTKRGNSSIAYTAASPKLLQSILIANRGEIAMSVWPMDTASLRADPWQTCWEDCGTVRHQDHYGLHEPRCPITARVKFTLLNQSRRYIRVSQWREDYRSSHGAWLLRHPPRLRLCR